MRNRCSSNFAGDAEQPLEHGRVRPRDERPFLVQRHLRVAVDQNGGEDDRQHAVLQAERAAAAAWRTAARPTSARSRSRRGTPRSPSTFRGRRVRPCCRAGRTPYPLALLAVQPRRLAAASRTCSARAGCPRSRAPPSSGCSNIASIRFRRAAAADEESDRRLMSSFRQCGVDGYTSSQACESRSLSCRADASFTSSPRQIPRAARRSPARTPIRGATAGSARRWPGGRCSSRRAVRSDSSSGVCSATQRRQTSSWHSSRRSNTSCGRAATTGRLGGGLDDLLPHRLPVARVPRQAVQHPPVRIARSPDSAAEQVGLEVRTVAVDRLEIAERAGLEVVPPGDQRLRRDLPGQEGGEVLVPLDGLPGGLQPVVDVDVAAFPQGVAARVAAEHHDGAPRERLRSPHRPRRRLPRRRRAACKHGARGGEPGGRAEGLQQPDASWPAGPQARSRRAAGRGRTAPPPTACPGAGRTAPGPREAMT